MTTNLTQATKVATVLTDPKKTNNLTMYHVLRAHSMDELRYMDTPGLKRCQEIIAAKIAMLEHQVQTHNLFFSRISEINADLRWYKKINDDLAYLLTAEYFAK